MKKIIFIVSVLSFMFCNGISGTTYFEYSDDKFSLSRTYLTYDNKISDDLSFKFQSDVDKVDDDDRLSVYLKKAQLDWKVSKSMKVSIGLIGMNMFNVQEKTWGHRFIAKSAIDNAGWSSSADLGFSITKDFGRVATNLTMTNGEGFKHMNVDKNVKTSLQLLYGEKKLDKKNGYNIGLVYSTLASDAVAGSWSYDWTFYTEGAGTCSGNNHNNKTDCENDITCGAGSNEQCLWTENDGTDGDDWLLTPTWANPIGETTKSVMGLFGGWSANNFRLGVEYNTLTTAEENVADINGSLTSLYLNYEINDNSTVFIRLDNLDPDTDTDNNETDTMMAGFIWSPTKGLKICPNMNQVDVNDATYKINFEFKF